MQVSEFDFICESKSRSRILFKKSSGIFFRCSRLNTTYWHQPSVVENGALMWGIIAVGVAWRFLILNGKLELSLTESFIFRGLKNALMLNRRSHDQLADWHWAISKLELIKLEFINKYSMLENLILTNREFLQH